MPSQRAALAAILVAAGVVCFGGLLPGDGLDEHECLVAETAREMTTSGDWVVPHFAQAPRIRKSPLAYWSVAVIGAARGRFDEWSARLPAAAAAMGTLLAIVCIARRTMTSRQTVLAGFVALTAAVMPLSAHDAAVDVQLTFWCAAAYAMWFEALHRRKSPGGRRWFYGFYLVFGSALLAKFPMGGVVVGMPIAVHTALMIVLRRWTLRELWSLRIVEGTLISLLIVSPWPLLVYRRVPEAAWQWKAELLERFADGERYAGARGWGGWLFYPAVLAAFVAPWTLSIPQALAVPFQGRNAERREELLLIACWLFVAGVIVSVPTFRRAHYAVPIAPALILLLAPAIERVFFEPLSVDTRRLRLVLIGVVVAIGVAAVAGVIVIHRREPAMFRLSIVLGVMTVILAAVAGHFFVFGRRLISLVSVGAISLVIVGGVIGARRLQPDVRDDWRKFAAKVGALVPVDQEVRWVGRQDAVAIFYGGGRLVAPRLDDPTALLRSTGGKFPGRFEWMQLVAATVVERLKESRPVWLVLDERAYGMIRCGVALPGFVALRSEMGGRTDDLVLLTNQPVGASAE